nr:hypothetical protein [Tanacetum cinerariifolium]
MRRRNGSNDLVEVEGLENLGEDVAAMKPKTMQKAVIISGGRVREPRGGNDECVDKLNGQVNDQGARANENVEGVSGNVEVVNGGVGGSPNFSTIIGHQLQNLLPASLAQDVAAMKPKTMQKAVMISGALTDEAVRNGSIKNVEKRGNVGEPSKDNKRARTRSAFATTANPVGRQNTGAWPKCTTCNSYHALEGPCRTCFNCNCPGHFLKDCRVVPRNVNLINERNLAPARGACYECGSTDHLKSACPRLNRAQGLGENHSNQVVANNGGQGHGNQ